MSKSDFRVIIVGGGISGLTLANCLQHIGVDYILLEAHREIAPQVGASIGLAPYGLRILDQLGVYSSIRQTETPIQTFIGRRADGKAFHEIGSALDVARLLLCSQPPQDQKTDSSRFGYLGSFSDRHIVLQYLFDRLLNKERVILEKRVCHVIHQDAGVMVECDDGTSYQGDVLVGADGVRSVVRAEMQRMRCQRIGENPSQQSVDCMCFACIETWLISDRSYRRICLHVRRFKSPFWKEAWSSRLCAR